MRGLIMEKFWEIKAVAGKNPELLIYKFIGDFFFINIAKFFSIKFHR